MQHQSKQLIKIESTWCKCNCCRGASTDCDLGPVCYLDDPLSVWLEAELRDDAELYLGAEREHELLVADHAVTGLLPRHMEPGCGHGVSARDARGEIIKQTVPEYMV